MTLNHLHAYVRDYNRAVFKLVACGRAAPSSARLERFEEAIGFRFPEIFREFSTSPVGGLCLEVCEDLWERPPADEPEEWKKLYDVRVFGLAAGVPERLDLNRELAALPPEESDLIPFMARGAERERYCFDLDHQLIRWCPADGSREVIPYDFISLLLAEIANLEDRWERYKRERKAKKGRKKRTRSKRSSTTLSTS